MGSWFPFPKSPNDIISTGVSPEKMLPTERIFALLVSETAVEWRDRVGVTAFENGAQKTATRLLCSAGWVFKTHTDLAKPAAQALVEQLQESEAVAQRYRLWHPQRFWFILRANDLYWPCTATPQMKTLHEVKSWTAKTRWWIEMLRISLETLLAHQVLPDIRMSNFGFTECREQLYYLDDELLHDAQIRDVGEALGMFPALRGGQTPAQWHAFGREINAALRPYISADAQWQAFVSAAAQQLPGAEYAQSHRALIDGLNDLPFRKFVRGRSGNKRPCICVLADVHANLPALNAVLQKAVTLGATHYLFLGDVVGYGPHPQACVQRLGNLPNLIAVQGNHDYWVSTTDWQRADEQNRMIAKWSRSTLQPTEISWLLKLPPEQRFPGWLARHGAPSNPDFMFGYVDDSSAADNLAALAAGNLPVAFFAHSHMPAVYSSAGSALHTKALSETELFAKGIRKLINPGSVGQPRDGDPRAAFAIWDRNNEMVRFYREAYPVGQTISDLKKCDFPAAVFQSLAIRLEQGR